MKGGAQDMMVYVKTREILPDITVMAFTGRLILDSQLKDVEDAIREQIMRGQRKLVLDFSGLNYIDSAGIGVVAVCIGLMERTGGKLAVVGAVGQVKQLLELTHLNLSVQTYPDLSSAQAALAGPITPPPQTTAC
jgi:anti-sigma B factor antagonist